MLATALAYAACKNLAILFLAHLPVTRLPALAAVLGGEDYTDALLLHTNAEVPDSLRGSGRALAFGIVLRETMRASSGCTAWSWLPHVAWGAATVCCFVHCADKRAQSGLGAMTSALLASVLTCTAPPDWTLWHGVLAVTVLQVGAVIGMVKISHVTFSGVLVAAPPWCAWGLALGFMSWYVARRWSQPRQEAKRPGVDEDLSRRLEAMESSLHAGGKHKLAPSRMFG